MSEKLKRLSICLREQLGSAIVSETLALDELTIVLSADQMLQTMLLLRDHAELGFAQLIDVCGVDYRDYGVGEREAPRFAAVYHLLSIAHNWRLRVRVFCPDDEWPRLASVIDIWPSANWHERETFDLFGIVFEGHPDLRRILTDYGFIGHPFRKDFPLSGYVEMRYDPELQRVIYQPVTIEPREVTPRIVRVEHYGDVE